MKKFVKGVCQFQQDTFTSQQLLLEGLANGQQPLALFITCSVSRIVPNLITKTDPGELFIVRNAGNFVPAYGTVARGEASTFKYAIGVLNIKDIIICGHSQCAALNGLLPPDQLPDLPAVNSRFGQAESTARIIKENDSHITDSQTLLTAAVEINVLVQLESLRTYPTVAWALNRGDVRLHGWVYKFETGQVFFYQPDQEHFVPLDEAALGPRSEQALCIQFDLSRVHLSYWSPCMSSKHSASTPLLRRVAQDHESQICFGAALICLGIGLCGLVLNMFFTLPASLDALFVTSVFFGLLGTVRAAHLQGEYSSGRLDLPREDSATHDQEKIRSAA